MASGFSPNYLTMTAAAARKGLTYNQMNYYVQRGRGPAHVFVESGKRKYYTIEAIDAWTPEKRQGGRKRKHNPSRKD